MSSTPVHLQCHILDTGYCIAWEHHVMQGGQRKKIACHSLVALLHHPQQGWLLWDTGYAPRILTATQRLPFLLYRYATPLRLRPELSIAAQLARWKLQPGDIRRVILSHFHADHIAGLRDFPEAEIIASNAAYEDIAWRQGIAALRRALFPRYCPTTSIHASALSHLLTGLLCLDWDQRTTCSAMARCCSWGCPDTLAGKWACSRKPGVAGYYSRRTAAGCGGQFASVAPLPG